MRLEITRKANLAITVLGTLDQAGTRVSGRDLAEQVGTTTAFLAQVVTPLVQEGWITSQPGRAGGYEFTADSDAVSVLDVIEAVEGPTDAAECVMRTGACSASDPCATHEAWSRARDALLAELAGTPVSVLSPRKVEQ